jgi:hypothetical protein
VRSGLPAWVIAVQDLALRESRSHSSLGPFGKAEECF